ncbi:AzlC family ABC transporter permease [Pseudalkalibacillus caeni]|uniref:AzlC family ABC transporter permease n=1 Tax=Exobacillus caeni TaxID=2574798 RepID=A0A5R9FC30_9BACL|nr:AzlC family ABC transporter permease [Pseudalkalibacillus caeni]TLS38114.1 AzlC family ABC transporter permease [Pseudalkalibacillus caeni]
MQASTAYQQRSSDFIRGIQAGLSIAIGYMPVALTYGLLAKTTGLSLFETIAMSMFVYAGAAQYITLSLLAIGTGALEIVFTIFIVNIRHLLMSASVNEKVEEDSIWKKALYAFGITDETFTVAATREGTVTTGFMFGLCLVAYSSWVIFSGAGHLIGSALPQTLQEAMGVALYAMFIGLLVPSVKKQRKVLYLAVVAAVLNSLFTVMNFSAGWSIVMATLISAVSIEILTGKGEKPVE